jgi:hypothetical protein
MAALPRVLLHRQRPVLAGQRFVDAADRPPLHMNLYLGLFGHLERVIDLNTEVADGALGPMSCGT